VSDDRFGWIEEAEEDEAEEAGADAKKAEARRPRRGGTTPASASVTSLLQ
jgi:hypothetical protein